MENFNSQFRKFNNGKLGKNSHFGMIQPLEPLQMRNKKGKTPSWESAMTSLFTGIAFAVISMILAFSAMGKGWWFWLLIPAFSCLGAGFAQIIQLRKNEKNLISVTPPEPQNALGEKQKTVLSSSQTDYINPESRYKTGDLAPPSVVENTTRHLEINSEGETMTLPKTGNKVN